MRPITPVGNLKFILPEVYVMILGILNPEYFVSLEKAQNKIGSIG
jgi:hypothetical protein